MTKGETSAQWVDAGAVDAFLPGELTQIILDGRTLVIVRVGGAFHAVDDACPHAGHPLHTGLLQKVEGRWCLRCRYHGWVFALDDGHTLTVGSTAQLRCYPVKLHEGRVWVHL